MKPIRIFVMAVAGLALAGCSSVDTATRNAPAQVVASGAVPVDQLSFDIQEIRVSVPKSLTVSEANRYLPKADIVWREDAPGDRHAQVQAIFEDAMARGVSGLPQGTLPVVLDIQVTRFHALTEKARYTVGGVHDLEFLVILRHPETGQMLNTPYQVTADLKAFGGSAALEAEARGETQKVRITDHLAKVIRTELTSQEGYKAPKHGVLGFLNSI
ncbi:DUF6778 family protein [Roseovarius rhodophyticola]|uniref:DUF6778 family protein n=1 Tax=Roseovarius rhodophyticola TaxID=3080827 RepID=A0ABZ2TDG2_9RHOB|nr:DUF6778 family protein [Roseovarius sp. W115]MDV2928004.1 DUF6778 family protein [Roseovarius sp. W115]